MTGHFLVRNMKITQNPLPLSTSYIYYIKLWITLSCTEHFYYFIVIRIAICLDNYRTLVKGARSFLVDNKTSEL